MICLSIKKTWCFLLLFCGVLSYPSVEAQNSRPKKGTLYGYWGWNRSAYNSSDIRFWGNNYDFTLQKVVASDKQTPFNIDIYFNLKTITIPQVNYRLGYFWSNHYDISIGLDHMKYVMLQDQTATINGHIHQTGTAFDGDYQDKALVLSENFLAFEHTDGLNYLNIEVNRYDKIADLSYFKLKNIEIELTEGISAGSLIPKTNTKLLNNKRYDAFHWAGYGFGAKVGLNISCWRYFFIQGELKGGFINMPDIRTTELTTDRAAQYFFFAQTNILFGFRVNLLKS